MLGSADIFTPSVTSFSLTGCELSRPQVAARERESSAGAGRSAEYMIMWILSVQDPGIVYYSEN